MTIADVAEWVGPAATMIAAMMTAANLGPRTTGVGFVVFTLGSLAWVFVAFSSGQTNLLVTNGFLTLFNVVGIWRWLGRQARYADGGHTAAARSAIGPAPSLASIAALPGAKLSGAEGSTLGVVVDAMMERLDAKLAYVVVREGGVVGVGERLHALTLDEVTISPGGLTCTLTADDLTRRPALTPDAWPVLVRLATPTS